MRLRRAWRVVCVSVCLSDIEFEFEFSSRLSARQGRQWRGRTWFRVCYHAFFLFSVSVWAHLHVTSYSNGPMHYNYYNAWAYALADRATQQCVRAQGTLRSSSSESSRESRRRITGRVWNSGTNLRLPLTLHVSLAFLCNIRAL